MGLGYFFWIMSLGYFNWILGLGNLILCFSSLIWFWALIIDLGLIDIGLGLDFKYGLCAWPIDLSFNFCFGLDTKFIWAWSLYILELSFFILSWFGLAIILGLLWYGLGFHLDCLIWVLDWNYWCLLLLFFFYLILNITLMFNSVK